jgi:curved DNA-binding protein CbpA
MSYKRLALLYHPDKGKEGNSDKIVQINLAFKELSDPVKRKQM